MIELLFYSCLTFSVFGLPVPIATATGKGSIVHPMYLAWAVTTVLWIGIAILVPLGLRA